MKLGRVRLAVAHDGGSLRERTCSLRTSGPVAVSLWNNELPHQGHFLSSVGRIRKLEPSLCEPGNITFQCLQNAV